MDLLGKILEFNKSYKVILIYTAEAHSDDVWPVGYGINQTKSLFERRENVEALFKKHKKLSDNRAKIVVLLDNKNNDFINRTGAWPECYLFADKKGICIHKTSFIQEGVEQLEEIRRSIEHGCLRYRDQCDYGHLNCPWFEHNNCKMPHGRKAY